MHAYICMLWIAHGGKLLMEGLIAALQNIHVGKRQLRVICQMISPVHVSQVAKQTRRSFGRKLAVQDDCCALPLQCHIAAKSERNPIIWACYVGRARNVAACIFIGVPETKDTVMCRGISCNFFVTSCACLRWCFTHIDRSKACTLQIIMTLCIRCCNITESVCAQRLRVTAIPTACSNTCVGSQGELLYKQ